MKNPKGNKGKWLEADILRAADHYRDHGFLRIEKVDPPTRVAYVGKPAKPVTIQLANPFLDFVGTWTEANGRAIFLEAKSTEKPSLMLCQEGGVTEKQWTALCNWELGGAACGILWGYAPTCEIRYLSLLLARSTLLGGRKSIRWEEVPPLKEGLGFVRWDWMEAMREAYPWRREFHGGCC